jgi:hypothetical protein
MPTTRPTTTAAEKRELRERMRAAGQDYRAIATEFARRYRLRPRTACREAYGWSLAQAARQINSFTGDVGLDPGGLCSMSASHLSEYENWPGEGEQATGRKPTPYLLAVLARVYGCPVPDLVDLADREHLPPADLLIIQTHSHGSQDTSAYAPSTPDQLQRTLSSPGHDPSRSAAVPAVPSQRQTVPPGPADATTYPPPGVAYRGIQESALRSSWVEHEVLMTAHEGSQHAERAEQRGIGEATLEQLRADVTRLSREYMTAEPFSVFLDMRRVRNRMHDALDRQMWPRDATDLYLLLGCLNDLMAIAAYDLGYPQAADELFRSAWAYAIAIDHHSLMARLRVDAANNVFWNEPKRSAALALVGLNYQHDGPNAAYIHLKHGRAAARMGDADTARRAISEAAEAREREHHDDLLAIGGEFNFSRASQHYLAGATLIELPGAEREAGAELEHAIDLYDRGPEPGEDHAQTSVFCAHIDLATTRLRAGQVDGAAAALTPVLALPPSRRFTGLGRRFARARAELAAPIFRGSAQASELADQIEEFGRESITTGLYSLPGIPG